MQQLYSWPWVEAQVAHTIAVWNGSAAPPVERAIESGSLRSSALGAVHRRYSLLEQQQRERAYDQAVREVERELRKAPRAKGDPLKTQARITASFAQFAANALDLDSEAITLLTDDFLPAGTHLARLARSFDPDLSMPDIIQACRNAWTACGLQSLLGEAMRLTPSIFGYSLLYPYSDNYLDREDISSQAKLRFSKRFRDRLRGESVCPEDDRETAVWALVRQIEDQYPRWNYPHVYACLLAIHRAQEESIAQLASAATDNDPGAILRISCAKGGTSVLADACLARGELSEQESRFAFEWGVLLQLGDDLQDVCEDMRRGSLTLFSRAVAEGKPLDSLVTQLLTFSDQVAARMDQLPHGTYKLKALMRMSWRSLILRAVADSHPFFSPDFLRQAEFYSPFRFDFLRSRNQRLASRKGLYATVFEAFLHAPDAERDYPASSDPSEYRSKTSHPDPVLGMSSNEC